MSEASTIRNALKHEVQRLVELSSLDRSDLAAMSPCHGWSALDVLEHVSITPILVARDLSKHFGLDLDTSVATGDLRQRLAAGRDLLTSALEPLAESDLDTDLPGPVGPMAARNALALALTEMTLHRCDVDITLGRGPSIPDNSAGQVLATLIDWLLLTSSSGASPPSGLRLTLEPDGLAPQTIQQSGGSWVRTDTHLESVPVRGRSTGLILFLSGRLSAEQASVTTDRSIAKALKQYLPGP